ncbi:acyl-CoA carboxylase subunit epsilon [Streptomyces sp. NPDC046928]|uniref:acyl-CoA carboxylase subunit epsilon n=1 Tax=Streptomyces sp. NPDC046928 TaxID=3155021 RepID=UPI0033F590AD
MTPTPADLLAATSVRVLRGAPSPEELAAFTAVLTLRLSPAPDPAPPRPSTAAWSRPDRTRPYTSPRAWHT